MIVILLNTDTMKSCRVLLVLVLSATSLSAWEHESQAQGCRLPVLNRMGRATRRRTLVTAMDASTNMELAMKILPTFGFGRNHDLKMTIMVQEYEGVNFKANIHVMFES